MYPLIEATEARIGEYVRSRCLPLDFDAWRRAPELAHDLNYYGLTVSDRCLPGPEITSDAALIGCLYVLAGSAIGGRSILKHVNQILGITPETGGRFFHGYGTEFAALWHSFWNFAGEHCPPGELSIAVESARGLFQSYIEVLDQNLA